MYLIKPSEAYLIAQGDELEEGHNYKILRTVNDKRQLILLRIS